MNTKHSEPFYISSNLFDNRRLKRRVCKWMERLRERQQLYLAQLRPSNLQHQQQLQQLQLHTPTSKTERGRRRCHLMLSRRHVAATLPAEITIDLLSDEEEEEPAARATCSATSGTNSLQLSTVPNITLVPVPVELAPAHSSTTVRQRKTLYAPGKRYGDISSTTTRRGQQFTESIVLTSDDEDELRRQHGQHNIARQHSIRSPPPLAPLTFSDSIEEVTVSLVPRSSTTANCQARLQQRCQQTRDFHSSSIVGTTFPNSCSTPTTSHYDGYLQVDVGSDVTATLPDETTVHTVIANRIYELSLSKLREGLASSGVPEYAHDILPEQLQKLSPAMRAKVAPMVAPSPPAPISLKLSSDLSISLISDDDDCDSGNNDSGGAGAGGACGGLSGGSEAHAAAKLLKQQQPQLSVVQHLQYPGHGTPVALPVMAPSLVPSTRRRKLG